MIPDHNHTLPVFFPPLYCNAAEFLIRRAGTKTSSFGERRRTLDDQPILRNERNGNRGANCSKPLTRPVGQGAYLVPVLLNTFVIRRNVNGKALLLDVRHLLEHALHGPHSYRHGRSAGLMLFTWFCSVPFMEDLYIAQYFGRRGHVEEKLIPSPFLGGSFIQRNGYVAEAEALFVVTRCIITVERCLSCCCLAKPELQRCAFIQLGKKARFPAVDQTSIRAVQCFNVRLLTFYGLNTA
ncbi:hypothetical protein Tcan_04981 [Toxocara canis]|uniref:Uncharacterized protein n=1 Tax=Toxocara canis TaxID=6265 RepID=A0A0B2W170_TOXCA|nr:hypothetical protein Tcan_04981 [Toxocara canis]